MAIPESNPSRVIRPPSVNGGLVDVVTNYAWTLSPKESRGDVPKAHLTEYQQSGGQLIAGIIYYGRVLNNVLNDGLMKTAVGVADTSDIYKFKYVADPTGWVYSFPFFSTMHTTRGNRFGHEDGNNPFSSFLTVGSELKQFGKAGLGLTGKSSDFLNSMDMWRQAAQGVISAALPGKISFENPQNWDNTDEESITIQFHLFNTGSVEDIVKNRNLAHVLRYNNTPSRRNFAIVDPPVIYDLFIPDIINLPACYMSQLSITNHGNTRLMDLGDGNMKTIPEAYGFNMTFQSLLMPTRNLLQALDKGQKVQAINSASNLLKIAEATIAVLAGNANAAQTLIYNQTYN